MKYSIIAILSITIFAVSCVKDRIQPTAPPVVKSATDTLMYYWSFNNGDTSIHTPDFGVTTGASFSYFANYVDETLADTTLGAVAGTDSGFCLRVRNPSDSLIFRMPTTGYDSIQLSFAEECSGSGSTQNLISYTVDGSHYITTALSSSSYIVNTTFGLNVFDFSSDPNVKHNPKFAVKIVFNNNNTGTSGNDRFDNWSLSGKRE